LKTKTNTKFELQKKHYSFCPLTVGKDDENVNSKSIIFKINSISIFKMCDKNLRYYLNGKYCEKFFFF
jgi:hypothetical protein